MVAEAAVCLALDADKLPKNYGILTPSSSMGSVFRERLKTLGLEFYTSN